MESKNQDQELKLETIEQNGVYHLIADGKRIGTYPNEQAFKAGAREAVRAWAESLGIDLKQKTELIPRHAVPETNLHRTIIKLLRPKV